MRKKERNCCPEPIEEIPETPAPGCLTLYAPFVYTHPPVPAGHVHDNRTTSHGNEEKLIKVGGNKTRDLPAFTGHVSNPVAGVPRSYPIKDHGASPAVPGDAVSAYEY